MTGAVTVGVPSLVTRDDVRRISEHLSDLAGVVALTVDARTGTVTVHGQVTSEEVRMAIAEAGHEVRQVPAPRAAPAARGSMR